MAKTSTAPKAIKALRSIDLVNESLKAGLISTLDESAQGAWFDKAVKMLEGQQISVRGLKATIESAEASTWLKPSHVQEFVKASQVRALIGGASIPLKKVITTVQDAKRGFGDEFDTILESSTTFAEFAEQIPARPTKARGAGKQTATEKDIKDALKDADAVITFALGALAELEGDAYLVRNLDNAIKLQSTIGLMVKTAKSLNHPAGKALSA
jgi:hypothetical protein